MVDITVPTTATPVADEAIGANEGVVTYGLDRTTLKKRNLNDIITLELPSGGTNGQVLTLDGAGKPIWATPSGGSGGVNFPTGGTDGQVLTRTGSGSGEAWESVPTELPTGGTTGQILTRTATGLVWMDVPITLPIGGIASTIKR